MYENNKEIFYDEKYGELRHVSLTPEHHVPTPTSVEYVVFRRRWLMLGLYVFFCMANALQWIQYAIIGDVIIKYYGVESSAVNWTSLVYMLTYIILIFPATLLYNKIGLRPCLILGSLGNCAGAWIKVVSVSPDLFWVTLLGQTVVACAQVFVMSTPATVAATWFGPSQVSTACAIGVFGMQFGNALGFLIPPLMVQDGTIEEIGRQLSVMFYMVAAFTTALLILTVIFVQSAPPSPPSAAQAGRGGPGANETLLEFVSAIWRMMRHPNFLLLFVANGINIGVYCAFVTFLNPMILQFYPGGQSAAGNIGVTMMAFGVTGAVLIGYFLDYTRKYKETCLVVYIMAMVAMGAYNFLLKNSPMIYLYVSGAFIGFFMIGYIPAGYEFGVEMTYPESESTAACVLAIGTQIFAFTLTLTYAAILENTGVAASNWAMCGALAVGSLLSALCKSDLRRQKAEKNSSN